MDEKQQLHEFVDLYARIGSKHKGEIKIKQVQDRKTTYIGRDNEGGGSVMMNEYRVNGKATGLGTACAVRRYTSASPLVIWRRMPGDPSLIGSHGNNIAHPFIHGGTGRVILSQEGKGRSNGKQAHET